MYRALDLELQVQRALKIIETPQGPRREQLRRRLRAEARAMARLGHPHVLPIHDVGSDGERDFVVMDLAEGGSTWDRIKGGPEVSAEQAIRWTIQVLQALEAAHAQGIVHRDVKPHNVLLDKHDRALLADFGIAMIAEDEGRTTRTGVAMGSLAFMAPEQRLDARSVGPAADLYSVGATLYQLVTGANPIDLFTVGEQHQRMQLLPPALRPIVGRATRLDALSRYPDAASMRQELQALQDIDLSLPVPRTQRPPSNEHPPTAVPATTTQATESLAPPPEPSPPEAGRVLGILLLGLILVAAMGWLALVDRSPAVAEAPPAVVEAESVPEPEPVVEPESVEVEEPEPEPAVVEVEPPPQEPVKETPSFGPSPNGVWQLRVNGMVYRYHLHGPDHALRGEMELVDAARTGARETYVVEGRYERETRTLSVDTLDEQKGIDLEGTLNGELSAFQGRCVLGMSFTSCTGKRL